MSNFIGTATEKVPIPRKVYLKKQNKH